MTQIIFMITTTNDTNNIFTNMITTINNTNNISTNMITNINKTIINFYIYF